MNKIYTICLLLISSAVNAGTLTVNNGANFTGTGNLMGDLVVDSGGNVAPTSACLSVQNATFSSGSRLSATIAGTDECVNYSQLQINGTADLAQADLNVVTDNYTLQVNDEFIILANDNSDAILGNFDQLLEDEIFTLDGNDIYMSYQTGDGNDAGFAFVFRYNVGGSVSGLANSNSLILQNNASDDMSMTSNGGFIFSDQNDGTDYAVTISSSDLTTPDQSCVVTGGNSGNNDGTGTISNSNDSSIQVNCTTAQYSIGGTVSGLLNGNQVVIDLNNGDSVMVANGTYSFSAIDDPETGFAYTAAVNTNPSSPNQTCLISNPTGVMHGANVTNVNVICTINQYDINVNVTGLANGNTLDFTNGADTHQVTVDEQFTLSVLDDLSAYSVAFTSQLSAPTQTCSVTTGNANGNLAGSDILIGVECSIIQYDININVTGLTNGNTLDFSNGVDTHQVTVDEQFTLSVLDDLSAYAVSFTSQLSAPNQTCSVTTGNANGNLAGSDILIAVQCTIIQYDININVTGLANGNSLDFSNGADTHQVTVDEQFTLSVLDDLTAYAVTFTEQLSAPNQTCLVTSNNTNGALAGADILVEVVCSINKYNIAVAVTGLANGNSLDFSNGADTHQVTVDEQFTLSTLDDLTAYAVTFTEQLSAPNQTCLVTSNNANGALAGADILVEVACTINQYDISVNVTGLANGNSLNFSNGADTHQVTVGEQFTLSVLDDLTAYAVTFTEQLSAPNQTCLVTSNNANGALAGADILVEVVCSINQYDINVNVTGLANGNSLDFSNGADTHQVTADELFTLSTLDDLSAYNVSFTSQLSAPNQTCTVTTDNANGNLAGSDILIGVECSIMQYDINVNVTGLANGNTLDFSNGADTYQVTVDEQFTMSVLDDLSAYDVSFTSQLNAPNQTCSVTTDNANGNLAGSDILIAVECSIIQYDINVNVTGLASGNTLDFSNGADTHQVTVDEQFTLSVLDDLSAYAVAFTSQLNAPNQTCSVTTGNANGNLAGSDILIAVECSITQYFVGGSVIGLETGSFLVLYLGAENLQVTGSSFVFVNAIDDLSNYDVTVLTHPSNPNQTCSIINGSNSITGADVDDIEVTCITNEYFIGGTVTGLLIGNLVVLQNNSSDDKSIFSNGAFVFTTPITDGQGYNVTITTEAIYPIQPCEVVNAVDTVAGIDVVNVELNCQIGDDLIYRHGFEDVPPNI